MLGCHFVSIYSIMLIIDEIDTSAATDLQREGEAMFQKIDPFTEPVRRILRYSAFLHCIFSAFVRRESLR